MLLETFLINSFNYLIDICIALILLLLISI